MISASTRALLALAAAAAAFSVTPVLAQFSLATVANPASDAPASDVATGVELSSASDLGAGIPVATTAATNLASVPTSASGDVPLSILPVVPTSVTGAATPTTATPIAAPAGAQSPSGSGSPGPATRPSSRPTSTSQPSVSSNAVPGSVARSSSSSSSSPPANGTALSSVAAVLGRGELAAAVLAVASAVFAALA